MSKKNIIVLIVLFVVIALLLIIYQSESLFKKTANYNLQKNNSLPAPLNEEYGDETPEFLTDEINSPDKKEINNEACIEIQAYSLRMVELMNSNYTGPKILEYGNKIKELGEKYEIDDEDYFNKYCEKRLDDNELEKIKERMRELGSNIE